MSFLLGDFLLTFSDDSTKALAAFDRIEARSKKFAQDIPKLLKIPFKASEEIKPTLDKVQSLVTKSAKDFAKLLTIPVKFLADSVGGDLKRADEQVRGWAARTTDFLKQSLTIPVGGFIGNLIGGTVANIKGSIIGMNAQLESTTLQFTTLMGDADKARQHVKDLFEYAKSTPFETEPVIQASRLLQTFGGDALNTKEELTRLGDAAATASRDISEVGFWYGRLYSSIKNGQPFGEAAARLQEMGILSGTARLQLEALQKQGKKGTEIWAAFQKEMDKNAGAMVLMANTWSGLTSTISDSIGISAATIFSPLFDAAKEALAIVATLLATDRFKAFVTSASAAFKGFMDNVMRMGEAALPIVAQVWGVMGPLISQGAKWGSSFVQVFAQGITTGLSFITNAVMGIADLLTGWLMPHSPPKILPNLDKWGMKTAQVWMDGWKSADFGLFNEIGGDIAKALQNAAGSGKISEKSQIPMLASIQGGLAQLLDGWKKTGTVSVDALKRMREAAGPAGQAVIDIAEAYLRVEQATKKTEQAQQDLNSTNARYDAALSPLNAQLNAIDDQISAIQSTRQMAELKTQLAGASGSEKQLIELQMKRISVQKQAQSQERARQKETDAIQKRIEAAQKESDLAKEQLVTLQARQNLEAESIAQAKQQTDLLRQLAAGAAQSGAAQGEAAKDTAAAMKKARDAAQAIQDRINGIVAGMGKAREAGEAMGNRVSGALTRVQTTAKGLLDRLGGVKALLAGLAGGLVGGRLFLMLAGAGPLLAGIGSALATLVSPLSLVVGLSGGLAYAWTANSGGIRDKLMPALNDLKGAIQPVLDGLREGGLLGALQALPKAVPNVLEVLGNLRTEAMTLAADAIPNLTRSLLDNKGFEKLLTNLGMSKKSFDDFRFNILSTVDNIREMLNPIIKTSGDIIKRLGDDAQKAGQWFMDKLLPPISQFASDFTTMMQPHIQWLSDFIKDPLLPMIEKFGAWIGENLPGAINVLRPLVVGLVDLGLSVVELTLKAIATTWTTYLEPAFTAMGKWLKDATGGWENLARGADKLKQSLKDIAQMLRDLSSGKLNMPAWLQRAIGMEETGPEHTAATGMGGGGGDWGGSATTTPARSGGGGATRSAAPRLAGQRAAGGPVSRGLAYLVGEPGPEIFVPDQDGFVIPPARSNPLSSPIGVGGQGAGQATQVNVTLTINNPVVDNAERLREMGTVLVQMATEAAEKAFSKGVDTLVLSS